jgi:hypothetical protein
MLLCHIPLFSDLSLMIKREIFGFHSSGGGGGDDYDDNLGLGAM